MKPTITNAFTVGSLRRENTLAAGDAGSPSASAGFPPTASPRPRGARVRGGTPTNQNQARGGSEGHPLAAMVAPMQADLRESDFGFSLELNPIQAIDAVNALVAACPEDTRFLVSMEQSVWSDGGSDASLSVIANRLGMTPLDTVNGDQLVLDADTLHTLTAITQPTRLLVVAVGGPIDPADAQAINRAIERARSPLLAELRALAALEVLGDRSVVLHARQREIPLMLVAENFRQYLAAVLDRPASNLAAPEIGVVEQLLAISGAITARPIETEVLTTSVDVGVNTSSERFTQPANLSLIYDRPSNTWHVG
jgi:hypothetical protein